MRTRRMLSGAAASAYKSNSSGNLLQLGSLFEVLPSSNTISDGMELYNHSVKSACEELYADAFFRPSSLLNTTRQKPNNDTLSSASSAMLAGGDTAGQFLRFEQSVFRLDRMLHSRKANKLLSMPNVLEADSLPEAAGKSKREEDEIASWLGGLGSRREGVDVGGVEMDGEGRLRKRVDVLRGLEVSDVFRRMLVVSSSAAERIQAEVLAAEKIPHIVPTQENAPTISEELEAPIAYRYTGPLLLLDADSLQLLSMDALLMLALAAGLDLGVSRPALVPRLLQTFVERVRTCKGEAESLLDKRFLGEYRSREELLALLQPRKRLSPKIAEIAEPVQTESTGGPLCVTLETSTSNSPQLTKSGRIKTEHQRREFTSEEDTALISFVEAFARRQTLVQAAFQAWRSTHAALLEPFEERLSALVKERAPPRIWELVWKEMAEAGFRRSPKAFSNRWLQLQRSIL